MKLNKLQRHTAYIIILTCVENKSYLPTISWDSHGFCFLWYKLVGECSGGMTGDDSLYSHFDTVLPELNAMMLNNDNRWPRMGDWETRIEWLKECIKKTA